LYFKCKHGYTIVSEYTILKSLMLKFMPRSSALLSALTCYFLFLGPLTAQNPVTCVTSVASPLLIRAEGMAERVGDIVLTCTGGTPAAAGAPVPTADVTIFLNTAVTSRLYPNGWSEALLIVDEPGSGIPGTSNTQLACSDPNGVCTIAGTGTGVGVYNGSAGRPNVFPGRVTRNTVTFPGIPIDPAGGTGNVRVLRITNIRANAAALSGADAVATIAVSGIASLVITNLQPTVAFVIPGLGFSVRSPDNFTVNNGTTANQCSSAQRIGVLRFTNLFGDAFGPRTSAAFVEGDSSPAPVVQNTPGLLSSPGNETGFYNPAMASPYVNFATAGLANAGTRLRATINHIAAGSSVYVSARNATFSDAGDPTAASTGAVARLVQNEATAFAALAPTGTLEGVPVVQLAVANGSATAVWEVLSSGSNTLDNFDFVVWVQSGASPGTATVNASLAPAPPGFDAASGSSASSTLPVPRFIADPNPAFTLFTSGECPFSTKTILSASPLTAAAGTPVNLIATVSSANGIPAGTVTFLDNGSSISDSLPAGGDGVLFIATNLSPGTHSLTAAFSSSSVTLLDSTSSAVTVKVLSPAMSGSGISVTSSLFPSVVGQSVTLTAVVAGDSGSSNPTGNILFMDELQPLGTVSLIAGQARLTVPFTAAGTHNIYVSYSGDSSYAEAATRFGLIVNRVTPTLALVSSASAAATGQSVTFTAQLTPPPAGAPAATGQVQFFDGANSVGTASVTEGGASLSLSNFTAQTHQISATYSGDMNWYSVRSAALTLTTSRGSTATALTVVFAPAQTTLAAAVTAAQGAVPVTGSLQFVDTATGAVLGASQISGGIGGL
jgi:hypothetical protein